LLFFITVLFTVLTLSVITISQKNYQGGCLSQRSHVAPSQLAVNLILIMFCTYLLLVK